MAKRPARRRHASKSISPVAEFLQAEIESLRDAVARLDRESAGHTRRCAEMQAEIDLLKRTLATSVPPLQRSREARGGAKPL
jgi:DNA polymerase/3'-5' exonuclease PolX